jgi:hypothetical protein
MKQLVKQVKQSLDYANEKVNLYKISNDINIFINCVNAVSAAQKEYNGAVNTCSLSTNEKIELKNSLHEIQVKFFNVNQIAPAS